MSKKLEQLRQKQQQLQEQIKAELGRQSARKRKEETRVKILLGSAFLKRLYRGDIAVEKVMALVQKEIDRDADKQLVEAFLASKKDDIQAKKSSASPASETAQPHPLQN